MDIENRKELKAFAGAQVERSPQREKILLYYCGILLAVAALSTGLNALLGQQISGLGGLGNAGRRAFFASLQTILSPVESCLLMCLDLGLISAALRMSRGQYASPNSLRLGFSRFFQLLQVALYRLILVTLLCIPALYLSLMLFLLSPFSDPVMAVLQPMVAAGRSAADLMLDQSAMQVVTSAMLPLLPIFLLVVLSLVAPILYRYRLAEFCIIDHPAQNGVRALRMSRELMKHHRMQLLKLDLALYPYYLALLLSGLLSYTDVLLGYVGIALPFSDTVSFYLFYGLGLGCQLVSAYFLRLKTEASYGLFYDSLRPREETGSGVVLGNIFQM